MSVTVIGALFGLMLIFGVVIGVVGYVSLDNAFKNEYASSTYRMADAATALVNGDRLHNYVEDNDPTTQEYVETNNKLQICCYKLHVSLIYIIEVDQSDYGRFVSVFNVVDNDVDNTNYSPWELNYHRNTTNDEYRTKYRNLYEQKSDYETLFRLKTTDGQHPHITTLVPVFNSSHDVVGILCMQRPVSEMYHSMMPYFFTLIVSVVLLGVVISVLSILFVNLAIIRPLGKVSREATRFSKDSTNANSIGKISRFAVIQNLANSIDSMETETIENIKSLTSITAEREKIGAELSIATSIQQDSLPKVENAFPNRKDFEIYASMNPAKEVGGDFYNFFLIDDDHLGLIIADVSGKGVPAALFMMVSNIVISDRARMVADPAKVIEYANQNIYEHNQTGMFVTVWLGILEISTGTLVSVNAGHEDPIIYRKKSNMFVENKEKHGFVVGGMGGLKYENQYTKLQKGDKIFVYTDGLSEAMDKDHNMFGIPRAVKTLNEHRNESPKELLSCVTDAVKEFVGDEPQSDDLTMMCVELK